MSAGVGDEERPVTEDARKRPAPARAARAVDAPRCDLCGSPMRESHCKLVCDQCGYIRDCSDP